MNAEPLVSAYFAIQSPFQEPLLGHHTFKRTSFIMIAAGIALSSLSACSTNKKTSTQAVHQRTVSEVDALADFDAMWTIVSNTHFDTDYNGTDWDAVRDELRPQAAEAQNRRQIRRVMNEALGRLGQSHFGILPGAPTKTATAADTSKKDSEGSKTDAVIPKESNSDGEGNADTGIDVRIIDGQAIVSSVRDQSPAKLAGVKTGWILSKARNSSITDRLDELAQSVSADEVSIHGVSMVTSGLQGAVDSTIDLTFIDGDNNEIELNITREPMPGEFIKFGNLPPLSTHLSYSRFTNISDSGETTEIGLIAFNIWMVPIAPKFERAMYELRDVDGLIIDLRGNPGGIGQLSSSIGRFLLSEKGSLGTMSMRGADLEFNIEPVIVTTWGEPLNPFTGPIAVLSDSGTASTSEVFAGGLQSLGRIEVFGTRSAGMALPAGMDKLPSGDVLLHAIADFVTSTGYQLEHGGVVPDHEVPLTRKDLLNGIDSPKQTASDWIAESINQ